MTHIEQILKKDISKKNDGFDQISETAFDLIKGLLQKNPEKRIGKAIEEIKNHPFFEEIDWEKVYQKNSEIEWRPSESDLEEFQFFGEVSDVEEGLGLEGLDVLGEIASFSEELGKGGFLPEFSFY